MKHIAETGKYKIYFRLWPFRYFVGRNTDVGYWCIMKKVFNDDWGQYMWKEIQGAVRVFILVQPIVMFSFLLTNLVQDFKAFI